MSAVSTAVTGFIGAAFLAVVASQAWQRWFEQKDAAADTAGGPTVTAAAAADEARARREAA